MWCVQMQLLTTRLTWSRSHISKLYNDNGSVYLSLKPKSKTSVWDQKSGLSPNYLWMQHVTWLQILVLAQSLITNLPLRPKFNLSNMVSNQMTVMHLHRQLLLIPRVKTLVLNQTTSTSPKANVNKYLGLSERQSDPMAKNLLNNT